jgi:hypothetical protein
VNLIDLSNRDVDKWTLRKVLEHGALAFECRNCWHLAHVDVLELVAIRFRKLRRHDQGSHGVPTLRQAARPVARPAQDGPQGSRLGTDASTCR